MKKQLLKFLIIPIILLLQSKEIYCQNSFGIMGGINIAKAKFHSKSSDYPKPIIKYNVGLFTEVVINNKLSIEPIVLYSLKGWKFKWYFEFPDGPDEGITNLHYLDFQLLSKYLIHKKLSLIGGGEIGYLIKTKKKPEVEHFENYFEKFDVSLIIGTEFKVSKLIRLNLKYLHGISNLISLDILDRNENKIGVKKYGKNLVLQFGVSFDIILKK